jgi:anaerobic ribonucleoside-triphosphate reductase
MTLPHRARGVKVLKAVSSPVRLHILNLLFDKSALSYTELMSQLKMHPSRDAGKFAYHLKFLLKANLIEVDAEAKKYYLTELGKMVIDIADRVDKKTLKTRGMMVRTSHSTLEEFDANKITNSLIKEAKMPPEQAKKIAKETEKLLQKSKIKYLTSPLVREIVNALLKGQEEYRHKLTRLGMPVHEVTALIDTKEARGANNILKKAGSHTFSEYTLLNGFPRDIADAYSSGKIHTNNLETWLLKPNEVMHDVRFFLQNGINPISPLQLSTNPPQTFEAALATIFNALLHVKEEINDAQTCDHFDTFLAPFIKNVEPEKAKESLRLFILNLNQNVSASLGLDISVPKVLADKPVIGQGGKIIGKYEDFNEETNRLATLLVNILVEENKPKPLLNPGIIIHITDDSLTKEKSRELLTKAHSLAAEKGIIYFAKMPRNEKILSFSSTGYKLDTELTGDWETDTIRTGNLGIVTINLPRIAHESENEPTKFFSILKERYELATRALEIKHRTLKQHAKTCLPFLTQNTTGDAYFRLDTCSSIVSFAGLEEAVEAFLPQSKSKDEKLKFVEEIVQATVGGKQRIGKKYRKRIFPSIIQSHEASERLAQLDIEKYGVAKVKFSGTRDKPFYSTSKRIQLDQTNPLHIQEQSLEFSQKTKNWTTGANLTIIELNETLCKPEELLNLTQQLIKMPTIELLTYNRKITYCFNCNESWIGTQSKCPSCSAVSTMIVFDRFSGT